MPKLLFPSPPISLKYWVTLDLSGVSFFISSRRLLRAAQLSVLPSLSRFLLLWSSPDQSVTSLNDRVSEVIPPQTIAPILPLPNGIDCAQRSAGILYHIDIALSGATAGFVKESSVHFESSTLSKIIPPYQLEWTFLILIDPTFASDACEAAPTSSLVLIGIHAPKFPISSVSAPTLTWYVLSSLFTYTVTSWSTSNILDAPFASS